MTNQDKPIDGSNEKEEMKEKPQEKKSIRELLFNEDGTPNIDMYLIWKGRKPFMRDDSMDDDYKITHKTIDSDGIYRQNFAIKEFSKTLHNTIIMHDIN